MQETYTFKTELKQILDLIIHSLYSNKEIFLRELISNASDAIDRLRFDALTNTELVKDGEEYKIDIRTDESAKTITVSDNGYGMSKERIVEDLGTIARSGTKEFLKQIQDAKERPELIGQFGVGFYASFMVADKVTVISKQAGSEDAVKWESDGKGEYSIEPAAKATRGTDIILHLREDAVEFLNTWTLKTIVKKYSDFVAHPIRIEMTKKEEKAEIKEMEIVNSQQAIWLKPQKDITAEQYNEFYKQTTHDFQPPLKVIHYKAEGTLEFKALLFIPEQTPWDLYFPDAKRGLSLYVQRVFILSDCEKLIPTWMRFLKGVIDSSDLSLNVSREMIQQDKMLDKIRQNVVAKIISVLTEMKEKEFPEYLKFWNTFGNVLKEGVSEDIQNREKIASLMLMESTRSDAGEKVNLDQYIECMIPEQDTIWYLVGDSRNALEKSPYLESFKEKGVEVLFFTDAVDEWVVSALKEYKGKKMKPVDKGEIKLDDQKKEEAEKATESHKEVFKKMQEYLPVKMVRASARLTSSAAVLVVDENAAGAHLERLMKRAGHEHEPSKRILELNPKHQVIQKVAEIFEKNPLDRKIEQIAKMLYDQAIIAEGSAIADPYDFAKRVNEWMLEAIENVTDK